MQPGTRSQAFPVDKRARLSENDLVAHDVSGLGNTSWERAKMTGPLAIAVCVSATGLLLMAGNSVASQTAEPLPKASDHWAFQKVARPTPPSTANSRWQRNPIDAFILSELEKKSLTPSPEAAKASLLRRAYLDLIGLPPSPEEMDAFIADSSPVAFERMVERLIDSPKHGERWARHWLDLARYAESEGFKEDGLRPNIWRYRDYVIRSLNADKPYDRFVQEQVAGDELWPENPDALIATGFNRHYPDEHNARNLRQRRQEILNDITDTTASVFIGMTVACARCHDHKFDPIPQADYYRLQAFFANVAAADSMPLVPSEELSRYKERLAEWERQTSAIRAEMAAIEAPKRKEIEDELIEKYPAEVQDALRKSPGERTSFDWLMYYKARQYLDPSSHQYVAPSTAVVGKLKGEKRERWHELRAQLDTFKHLHPDQLPVGSGIHDVSDEAPPTHLLNRGVYDKPREEVEPGFLQVVNIRPAEIQPPASGKSTGRRTALARILTDPKNPFAARVMANRIWQYHFGRGLVGTPSDFGLKGERPTHLALLDWLASEFARTGWSIKHMHRLIVTSATYRQSSDWREAATGSDADNKLYWRYPRHRLEGEVIRDCGLSVAELMDEKMYGPSVWPELPPGMASRGGWRTTQDESERNRRSVYVVVKRNTRYPMFETFDMPDTHEPCARRNITTSPVQALTMLNSELTLSWAEHFAGRVLKSAGVNAEKQVDGAFHIAFGRSPDAEEKRLASNFLSEHSRILQSRLDAGEKLPLPPELPPGCEKVQAAALVDFCHMLINANEFVYLN
jgi:hypothetical protein